MYCTVQSDANIIFTLISSPDPPSLHFLSVGSTLHTVKVIMKTAVQYLEFGFRRGKRISCYLNSSFSSFFFWLMIIEEDILGHVFMSLLRTRFYSFSTGFYSSKSFAKDNNYLFVNRIFSPVR